jgi:hypothetical protein
LSLIANQEEKKGEAKNKDKQKERLEFIEKQKKATSD